MQCFKIKIKKNSEYHSKKYIRTKRKRSRGQRWSFHCNTAILPLIHDHLIIMSSYNHKLYPGLSKWQNLNLDFLKTSICFCCKSGWQFYIYLKSLCSGWWKGFHLFCDNNVLWLHSNRHPSSFYYCSPHTPSHWQYSPTFAVCLKQVTITTLLFSWCWGLFLCLRTTSTKIKNKNNYWIAFLKNWSITFQNNLFGLDCFNYWK